MNGATFPYQGEPAERAESVSVQAEARLLALGFTRLSALDSILGKVQARDFGDDLHRRVWPILTAARAAGESEIDPIAIADRIGGDRERLPELMQDLNLISQQTSP